jgi:hypothetical protein
VASRERASLFPLPDSNEERMTTATYGLRCFDLYEKFNPHGSSLKTFLASLLNNQEWYSRARVLTWRHRVTKCNRLLFQLVASTRRTCDTAYSLLPTAQTQGLKTCSNGKTKFLDLSLLPTPKASDDIRGGVNIGKKNGRSGKSLADLKVSGLFPTPL